MVDCLRQNRERVLGKEKEEVEEEKEEDNRVSIWATILPCGKLLNRGSEAPNPIVTFVYSPVILDWQSWKVVPHLSC